MELGFKGVSPYFRLNIEHVYQIFNWQSPDYIFLDVRENYELASGFIPGSRHINLSELEERAGKLDKSRHYILVCRYGSMSSIGCTILTRLGFSRVYNFVGGMLEWNEKNLPLIRQD